MKYAFVPARLRFHFDGSVHAFMTLLMKTHLRLGNILWVTCLPTVALFLLMAIFG